MTIDVHVHMRSEEEILKRLDRIEERLSEAAGEVSIEDQRLLDRMTNRSERITAKLERLAARTP